VTPRHLPTEGTAIMSRIIELQALIETLESDLQNRPRAKEFANDFTREMMQKTLDDAKAELSKLTKGQ
jgi:hemerythrin superfamily protein